VKETSSYQANAVGDVVVGVTSARAGTAEFLVGQKARNSPQGGATPYDLLSASLAACTAMTIQHLAKRDGYALSHVDVDVSYTHSKTGGRDMSNRIITFDGDLTSEDKKCLLRFAEVCPIGKTLSRIADIRTREQSAGDGYVDVPSDYERELIELSIPNIDPD
jgi:putative redox protein